MGVGGCGGITLTDNVLTWRRAQALNWIEVHCLWPYLACYLACTALFINAGFSIVNWRQACNLSLVHPFHPFPNSPTLGACTNVHTLTAKTVTTTTITTTIPLDITTSWAARASSRNRLSSFFPSFFLSPAVSSPDRIDSWDIFRDIRCWRAKSCRNPDLRPQFVGILLKDGCLFEVK